MKIKYLLIVCSICLLFTSCDKNDPNATLNSFEATFKKNGLSKPFAFQYRIKTEEGLKVVLSSQQVIDFMTGHLFDKNINRTLTNFQLQQSPDKDSNEFALMATTSSSLTQVKALLVKTEYGFEMTGAICECQSTAIINIEVQNWDGTCACKTDSQDAKVTKIASINTPDIKMLSTQ